MHFKANRHGIAGSSNKNEDGAVLPFLAIFLVPLCAFIALSVGIAIYASFLHDQQRSVDAAATVALARYMEMVREQLDVGSDEDEIEYEDIMDSVKFKVSQALRANFLENPAKNQMESAEAFHQTIMVKTFDSEPDPDTSGIVEFGKVWFADQAPGLGPPCGEIGCFQTREYDDFSNINAAKISVYLPDDNRFLHNFARVMGHEASQGSRSAIATMVPLTVGIMVDGSRSVVANYSRAGLGVMRDPALLAGKCDDMEWDTRGFSGCAEMCDAAWPDEFDFPEACDVTLEPAKGSYWWVNPCCAYPGTSVPFAMLVDDFLDGEGDCFEIEPLAELADRTMPPGTNPGSYSIYGVSDTVDAWNLRGAGQISGDYPDWVFNPDIYGLALEKPPASYYRHLDEYYCQAITFKGLSGEPDKVENYLIHYNNNSVSDLNDYQAEPQPLHDIFRATMEAMQILYDNRQAKNYVYFNFFDHQNFGGYRQLGPISPGGVEYANLINAIDIVDKNWSKMGEDSFITLGLFPRFGAYTDGRGAIIRMVNNILGQPNYDLRRNVALMFTDGEFNCSAAKGCGSRGDHILEALKELIEDKALIETIRQNEIKIHIIALNEHSHNILTKSSLAQGCMVGDEALHIGMQDFSLSNYDNYILPQGSPGYIDVNEDYKLRYEKPFLLSNVLARFAYSIKSKYFPIKDCLRNSEGKCVQITAEANAYCRSVAATSGTPLGSVSISVEGENKQITTPDGRLMYNLEGLELPELMALVTSTVVKNPVQVVRDINDLP